MANKLSPAPIDNDPKPGSDETQKKLRAWISTPTWGAFKVWFDLIYKILKGFTSDSAGNVTLAGDLTVEGSLNGLPPQDLNNFGLTSYVVPARAVLRVAKGTVQSIPSNTPTTIVAWDTPFDPVGMFNATTGVVTIVYPGIYIVQARILYDSAAWTAGQLVNLMIVKNGTSTSTVDFFFPVTTTTFSNTISSSELYDCVAGNTITVQTAQSNAASRNIIGNSSFNELIVYKVA